MKHLFDILLCVAMMVTVSCVPRLDGTGEDAVIARVGSNYLEVSDLRKVLPQGITGADSASYADAYVSKWMVSQLKLNEAESLFSSSQEDIDRMVEEYRRSLFMRKIDQHYLDAELDESVTDAEIAAYYNAHKGDFRVTGPMVKGTIVVVRDDYRRRDQLLKMMTSKREEQRQDFEQLCRKNNFQLVKYEEWVDFAEFVSHLPLTRSSHHETLLSKREVQRIHASNSYYCFVITDALRAGDTMPLYMARENIRRILINRRCADIVRRHEEQLLQSALSSGHARTYGRDEE